MWDIAKSQDLSWIRYWKWGQVYGDIFHLQVLGHHIVVLNSREAITTLLDKRSYNYSDRPDMHMFLDKELVSAEWGFVGTSQSPNAMQPLKCWPHVSCFEGFRHTDWWRLHRRTFHQRFQPRVMPEYHDIQRIATGSLIEKLATSPSDFIGHINKCHSFSGSIILKIAYGYTMQAKDDPYMSLVLDAAEGIVESSSHGFFWVDYFPVLKHVPAWFPGAKFKSKAKEWKRSNQKLRDEPYSWVQRTMEEGAAHPSFCTRLMDRFSVIPGDNSAMENVIKNCAASAFIAGSETTATALISFILVMALHPEFQIQAQKEIDTVVGSGSLPDFDDRDKLPFVNALIAETLRWNPVVPLGVAHRASDDDEYEGYLIPAGTTIIANAW
ncbi:hypothetical protein PM082_010282 [Marasmius tenuissimus]|nr:hypothetical protein PM082_010282 [Marasmius tenuissimus]